MKPKKRHGNATDRIRFKWWIKNNFIFLLIIGIICVIVALIFGTQVYNFQRMKNMETILGKNTREIHRRTGLTDEDVEKLKNAHPEFNWEGTWDRERWQSGVEAAKERRSGESARKK